MELAILSQPIGYYWLLTWVLALLTVPSVLTQRAARPIAALSWLLALFAFPMFTVIVWWLFGRHHLNRKKRTRHLASVQMREKLKHVESQFTDTHAIPPPHSKLMQFIPSTLHPSVFPPTLGNRAKLLENTQQVHQCWKYLIQSAVHHIHLIFYIWQKDTTGLQLRALLVEKLREGVEVRIVVDTVGSFNLSRSFFSPLTDLGAEVAFFMAGKHIKKWRFVNFRNHRKLIIADGKRAYTGGVNIGDEYLQWLDIGLFIDGPGVNQLQEIFADDWFYLTEKSLESAYFNCDLSNIEMTRNSTFSSELIDEVTCETVASGPDQPVNLVHEMLMVAVAQCRNHLVIVTPYFLPDLAFIALLRTAVYRGVKVQIIVPAQSDNRLVKRASRVNYRNLLNIGIDIFEYKGMLHAKMMICDDDVVFIGSANVDHRSFRLNFELGSFVYHPKIGQQALNIVNDMRKNSQAVCLESLKSQTYGSRLLDIIAHLVSPLL